jgi:hypothetical protein
MIKSEYVSDSSDKTGHSFTSPDDPKVREILKKKKEPLPGIEFVSWLSN